MNKIPITKVIILFMVVYFKIVKTGNKYTPYSSKLQKVEYPFSYSKRFSYFCDKHYET